MTTIHKSALVPYTPEEMFALVDGIDSYPSFLPWCKSARVLRRSDDEVEASIEIAKGGVEKVFTTRNRNQPGKMIEMRLVEGPFRVLEGFWRFEPLGDEACKLSLDLEYEFSSALLAVALGPIFHQITNSLVDAFSKRAEAVYGKR